MRWAWVGILCISVFVLLTEARRRRPSDCGSNEFWHKHHKRCRPCPSCSQGFVLKKRCGDGEGYPARCEEACKANQFIEFLGKRGHICHTCINCLDLLRTEVQPCQRLQDTRCGDCLPGHVDMYSIDAVDKNEMFPCSPCNEWDGARNMQACEGHIDL